MTALTLACALWSALSGGPPSALPAIVVEPSATTLEGTGTVTVSYTIEADATLSVTSLNAWREVARSTSMSLISSTQGGMQRTNTLRLTLAPARLGTVPVPTVTAVSGARQQGSPDVYVTVRGPLGPQAAETEETPGTAFLQWDLPRAAGTGAEFDVRLLLWLKKDVALQQLKLGSLRVPKAKRRVLDGDRDAPAELSTRRDDYVRVLLLHERWQVSTPGELVVPGVTVDLLFGGARRDTVRTTPAKILVRAGLPDPFAPKVPL